MAARSRTSSSATDRATAYAKDVIAGKIVAGPHVRNACKRHIDDLKSGPKRGLKYDEAIAARALRFFETKLKLSEGQFEGRPFQAHPSQAFIIGSLFGWQKLSADFGWVRRFRRAYIEQGKGNGKSPIAGGIGLYGLMVDGESGAEIYAAGATKDQAGILFRDAVKMVGKSPDLADRIKASGGVGREYNLAYLAKGSFFRPISREAKRTGSGPRPHMALCDEVHEHPDRGVMEMLERGFKFRRQPLLLMITNSGSDRNSVCWEEHEHAVKVAAGNRDVRDGDATYLGEAIDDTTFSFVCSLDSERTETVSYSQAVQHMRMSCTCHSVPTTLTEQLTREVFATHVTSSGTNKRADQGALSTQTGPSLRRGSAPSAITSPQKDGRPSQWQSGANIRSDGSKKTATSCENTKQNGWQTSPDTDWKKLSNSVFAAMGLPTQTINGLSPNKAENARSVAKSHNGSASITAMTADYIAACSASPATQELVFSEILRRTWNAHLPTCEARKSELLGPVLKAHFKADDPLTDPTCWPKANPLLGVTITEEYLAGVVAQAKAMPGKLNGILRLHFCVWTDADTAWISRETLEPALVEFDPDEYHGNRVGIGLDLSQTQDLTVKACATIVDYIDVEEVRDDGDIVTVNRPIIAAWIEAWTPGDTVAQRQLRDKAPYDVWINGGHLHAPPGKIISYAHVAASVARDASVYDAVLAYDRYAYRANFEPELASTGCQIEQIEHPQGGKKKGKATEAMKEAARNDDKEPEGLWMPGSVKLVETLLLENRLRILRNPVIISAMMSAVIERDPWGNYWLSKERAVNKIDAAIALCMAVGVLLNTDPDAGRSAYEKHDLLFI